MNGVFFYQDTLFKFHHEVVFVGTGIATMNVIQEFTLWATQFTSKPMGKDLIKARKKIRQPQDGFIVFMRFNTYEVEALSILGLNDLPRANIPPPTGGMG